jgi:16S rRNA (cytidine1402-2'-O)-methyltransferase
MGGKAVGDGNNPGQTTACPPAAPTAGDGDRGHTEAAAGQGTRAAPSLAGQDLARAEALVARGGEVLKGLLATPLSAGLHLVATPIGNLGDITLRALSALALADVLYCEDTRHSRILLAHYAIRRQSRAYHEHNAERERPRILAELAAGRSIALICDAGTPLVSDPGYKLVRAALAAGHRVTSLPGPSALLAALGSGGVASDTFLFAGFLPARAAARRRRLAELAGIPASLVFFEAASRLAEALADIGAALGEREAAVARELTKLHEEVRRDTLSALAAWASASPPRGELVILVAPPRALPVTDEAIVARLEPLLAHMRLGDAARTVAADLGVPRQRAYALGLALRG